MCKSTGIVSKIMNLDELRVRLKDLKRKGKKIVFTNGCFDILHAGHVDLLEKARLQGDVLVLGINSDKSVKELKGEKRPVIPQHQRAFVAAGLEPVDFVVIFDEPDPFNVISQIVPDVLVKGGDWSPETIIGADVVEKHGGRILSLSFMEGVSTTGIINKICKIYYQIGG